MVKRVKFKTFIIFFILMGLYLFVFSENGILERWELQKRYNLLNEKIDLIKESNLNLNNESENYRAGKFNSKEITDSGFVNKTGKVMYINDTTKDQVKSSETAGDEFIISPAHLRFIWILFSIMFLFFYFFKNNNSRDLTDGSDIN
ncbi:MAG: hypothetical protein FWG49_07720 [Leptospirales bacterium]|nr:hypothetical protein [Leptospirales bacterium]